VAWVDFETGYRAMLARLRDLGLDDEAIRRFLYVSPSEAMVGATITRDVQEMLAEFRPSLAVVDAFTGALEIQGLDPNRGVEVERFYRTVVTPLQEFDAAALLLDHVVKNKEARGKFSIGAERKLAGADVHLGFELVQEFARGRTGRVKIVTHKDRPGYLPRPKAAELELVSDADTGRVTWAWHLAERAAEGKAHLPFRPTGLMEKVSRYVESRPEAVSRNAIETAVTGKRQFVRMAIDLLTNEGFLEAERGERNARLYVSARPFREDDFAPTSPRDNGAHLAPTSPRQEPLIQAK
jgi:hypothetical protein